MNEFGKLLRQARLRSTDPHDPSRGLTQEQLGSLIGQVVGDEGYSGAAISNWERGRHHLHKDEQPVLAALIQVLYDGGGLTTLAEADELLAAGNYRLSATALRRIFPDAEITPPERPSEEEPPPGQWRLAVMFLGELAFQPSKKIRALLGSAAGGGRPRWPNLMLGLLGELFDHGSSRGVLRAIIWLGIWLLGWGLTFPLMGWPFHDAGSVYRAALYYAAGSIIVPLLIGAMVSTRSDPFWQDKAPVSRITLRLYTHQGASVGFNLGVITLFGLALVVFYVDLWPIPRLLAGLAALWPLILGLAAARQVPINLWGAFKQLRLKDGAIFFVFFLFGPAWALFFHASHPMLLSRHLGPIILLGAIGSLAALTLWQQKRSGSSIIPASIWATIFGTLAVLNELVKGTDWRATVLLVVILTVIIFVTVVVERRR